MGKVTYGIGHYGFMGSETEVRHGKLTMGEDCQVGRNVVIDVAEEVVLGDRCVIGDNTYFGGRRVEIGDDFYGYSHWNKRLEIGLGRRDDEHAILRVGSRCTMHDNKIDLAREVTIGDDVGLSPEVAIYTHGYWQSVLDGYPMDYADVWLFDGCIIGFRSTILPGARVGTRAVVGAGAVVYGDLDGECIYVGVPAKKIKLVRHAYVGIEREVIMKSMMNLYNDTRKYRRHMNMFVLDYPVISYPGCRLNVDELTCKGDEDEHTDDLREFLFKHGIRIYTKRPFRKLPKR